MKKYLIHEKILPYNTDNSNLDEHSKCVWNRSKCQREKKTCSEITDVSICFNHELDDTNKMCVYDHRI